MLSKLATARLAGKIYTIGNNDAILSVFTSTEPPTKETKESMAFQELLRQENPKQKEYISQVVGSPMA